MPKVAIFLEPNKALRELILDSKAFIQTNYADSPYCSHPPHCTLIHGDFGDPQIWLPALYEKLSNIQPFEVSPKCWNVFYSDSFTNGDTIVIDLTRPKCIYELQLEIAQTLAPHKNFFPEANLPKLNNDAITSFRKYGFPFVGPHWIPHMTIASITDKQNKTGYQLLNTPIPTTPMIISEVSIWNVDGDSHTMIKRIKFGKNSNQ